MDKETIAEIERITQHKFRKRRLLEVAFTHSSAVDNRLISNERLEFLGDAVFGFIICEALYRRFEDYLEGDLTKLKSTLVSRRTCAEVVKKLNLHKLLKIGKGMTGSRSVGGSLAAGLFEALVAVLYLDGGLEAARRFVLSQFEPLIEQTDAKYSQDNFKSLLQQYAQQHFGATPAYVLLDEKGPDHDKCFEVQVVIGTQYFDSAWGTNKKQAEQKAALNALVALRVLRPQDVQPQQ